MTTQAEIAKILGISQGYLSKGLQWATARNKERSKGNNSGIVSSSSHLPTAQPQAEKEAKPATKLMLRLHRLQRKYKITNAVSEDRLRSLGLKENKLHNNSQFLGSGFRITTQSLELEGIEVWSNRNVALGIVEGIAHSLSDAMAEGLANQYGITIDMKSAESPEGLQEVELTEHALAEAEKQKGIIALHYDSITHKADVWMDKSFGLGGLESNKLPYLQKLTDMTNDIIEYNAWQEIKANQLAFSKQLAKLAEQVTILATNVNVHEPFWESMNIVARKLTSSNPKTRQQASKAIGEVAKQSKLSSFAGKPSEDAGKLAEALDKALKEGLQASSS
jgi:hypothetical protein